MGKKGSWFSAVKRVWYSDNKKKDKEAQSRGAETEKKENLDDSQNGETTLVNPIPSLIPLPEAVPPPGPDDDEQSRHAYSVAFATAIAAEAAVAAAQAAAEVVRLTSAARSSRKPKEETAAIKIQSAFRGYMARRAHEGLRKLVRLKSMISERSVKQQAITTLKCMQTIAKLQSEVRARRNRLSEENRVLQRQLQQKPEKELEKTKPPGGKFDVSTHTKEQIKAKNESRQEAAKRRERALSYAYTHQMTRRTPLKSTNQTLMDPNNPQWGWSWLEKWMAARPWDDRVAVIKELSSNDTAPVKTTPKVNAKSSNKELTVKTPLKTNASSADKEPRNDPLPVKTAPKVNKQSCPPPSRQSPLNIASTLPPAARLPVQVSHENDDPRSKTIVNLSSKGSLENDDPRSKTNVNLSSKGSQENDDPRSKTNVNLSSKGSQENDDPRINPGENSENSRRHSSAEATERECDHIARPQVSRNPCFMAAKETAKARTRMAAPLLVLEKRYGTLEKEGSAKKKLSSHGVTRRHSAPPALI